MGQIAEKYSNHIILTSDNSRSEDPQSIINEIIEGITKPEYIKFVNTNRKDAIAYSIDTARQNDIVIIAGKGHETRQYCKGFSYEYADINIIVFCQFRRYQKSNNTVKK